MTPANGGVAILGGGNLGRALARGWLTAGRYAPGDLSLTRRQPDRLTDLAAEGCDVGADNLAAVRRRRTVILAVQPQQLEPLAREISEALDPAHHWLVSVVSGVTLEQLRSLIVRPVPIIRAMPNTAVSIGESMTCLSAGAHADEALREAERLFSLVGRTLVIPEELMLPATALCACGVAFFLRAVRAASQGGIEIGFHPEDALLLAAQTARGASALLLSQGDHPEAQIDRVTTPRGCTIAGLNEMEHHGLSSAMIKGIVTSAEKAARLFRD